MKDCFVIMPIGRGDRFDTFKNRYERIIRPAVDAVQIDGAPQFHCIRADEVTQGGSIADDFLRRLYHAPAVIADLTSANANVFYELGVRHALRSGTVLIALRDTPLPFDVAGLRVIEYDDTAEGDQTAIARLSNELKEICAERAGNDSPVFTAIPEAQRPAVAPMEFLDGVRWRRLDNGAISSPLDGYWHEMLDRREGGLKEGRVVRHHSLFRFEYNRHSHLHPFIMSGSSYTTSGTLHSSWDTCYMHITTDGNTIHVEYIYSANVRGERDPRRGYGVSHFSFEADGSVRTGHGSYLAGEERDPYPCPYEITRTNGPVDDPVRFIRALGEG